MIELSSEITVTPIAVAGNDRQIAAAAWLTTGKDAESATDEDVHRLLSMLMRDGHGSPFEFGMLQFQVEAPIFVFRQWHRHRIGWSYSEVSGRWHRPGSPPPLKPKFWAPHPSRKMVASPDHKPSKPDYTAPSRDVYGMVFGGIGSSAEIAWANYECMLNAGVAAEVARAVLPVTTYTTCRVQCNPRSLMAFLAKRVNHPMNHKRTNPQLEIQEAATAMENVWRQHWPITAKAFDEHGRVAP